MKKYILILILILSASSFAQSIQHYHSAVIKNKISAGGSAEYTTRNLRFLWLEDSLDVGDIGAQYSATAWYDAVVDSGLGTAFAPRMDADSGVVWDGLDDYLRMSPLPSNLLYGGGVTFEIVVNLVSLTNMQYLIGARYESPNIQIFQLYINGDDSLSVFHYDDGVETYDLRVDATSLVGEYTHIVGTTDNSGGLALYVNGQPVNGNNAGSYSDLISSNTSLFVGGELGSYNLAIGSAVRAIKIHDDDLTAGEIEADYDWFLAGGYLAND